MHMFVYIDKNIYSGYYVIIGEVNTQSTKASAPPYIHVARRD